MAPSVARLRISARRSGSAKEAEKRPDARPTIDWGEKARRSSESLALSSFSVKKGISSSAEKRILYSPKGRGAGNGSAFYPEPVRLLAYSFKRTPSRSFLKMLLRWYQQQAVQAVWDFLRNEPGNPCVVLPTGSGKTPVIAELCRQVVEWGGRALVLAHVKELLQQTSEKLGLFVDPSLVGVYSAGLNERTTSTPIVVAGIQSVYQRAEELGAFQLIVVDEAHLIPPNGSGRYRQFYEAARGVNPQTRLVGLTATPYRMGCGWITRDRADEESEEERLQTPYDRILDRVVYEVPVDRLIADGTLSRVVSVAAKSSPDFSGVHITRGDYDEEEIEKVLRGKNVLDCCCSEIVQKTQDRKKVVIFCNRRESANKVRALLATFDTKNDAEVVDGDTSSGDRAEIVRRFKNDGGDADLFGGETKPLKYVANVGVLTTGFDAPNVDCVVLLRPTRSLALYQQIIGRGLRTAPEKSDCLVLDYGGNVDRHGPIDIARPAATFGDAKKVWKDCKNCGAIVAAFYAVCPQCGESFPNFGRRGGGPSDPNAKLQKNASTSSVLASDVPDPEEEIVEEFSVREVQYEEHWKKNAEPGTPPTLQVCYKLDGPYRPRFEWLCPEHESRFARNKFEEWWKNKSKTPPPASVATAVLYAKKGALATPKKIRTTTGRGKNGRFPRIEWLEASELPEFDPLNLRSDEEEFFAGDDAFANDFAAFAEEPNRGEEEETIWRKGDDEEEPAPRTCEACRNFSPDEEEPRRWYCTLYGKSGEDLPEGAGPDVCFEEAWPEEDVPF